MTTFKRFLTLFFIATLSAFTMHVWGASPATFTFNTDAGIAALGITKPSTGNGTSLVGPYTVEEISMAVTHGSTDTRVWNSGGTLDLRIYKSGGSLTFSCTSGYKITSIVLAGSAVNSFTYDGSDGAFSSGTWTAGSGKTATSVELTATNTGKINTITVSYESTGGGSPTLSSISVKTAPTKVSYTEGEYFDPTGLVITRTYNGDTPSDWTYADHTSDFTFSPSLLTALTTSDASVTITYGGKSTTQAITVTSGGGGGGGSCSVFHETWDGCNGTGGNSGGWSGTVATSSAVVSDNSGWTYSTGYKGDQCIRTSKGGYAQTPSISVSSGTTYTLSYNAADWGTDGCTFALTATGATITAGSSSGTLSTGSWGSHSATLTATASTMQITFTASSGDRGWLDEICIDAAGPSYTVTATVDDAAHGSVSVSGNTITVTPNPGWVPNGYTVTSGTATAAQSGNIFTVTPSEDCNVQINFRAADTYTITIIDNGGSYNATATEGVPYELPDNGLSSCDDAILLGWATGEYTGHLAGTSIEPTYDAPGASKTITGNTTFTAVYGIVTEGVSNDYTKITAIEQLQTGDYIIAAHGTYAEYAMKNVVVSSSYMDEEDFTKGTNPITTTNTSVIWHITKTGTNYTIYNAEINKYLVTSTSGPQLLDAAHNYTVAYNGSCWAFESTTTGYQLAYNGYFRSLTAQDEYDIYLYRRDSGIGTWTSKPQCCQAPATALSISSETTNFIGSGTTTVSISGGNGQAVTWSCKDEADNNCNSYLSGSGTTRTLTLPTNTATKTYTVTVTQPDNESDPDNVICGATVNVNVTVKAQFTINFKTIDGGSESLYSSTTVTDGDTYEMPSLAEDFDCGTSGKSFMGWASTNDATSVEYTAGSNVTASSSVTWYACWSTSSDVTLVYLYEKITSSGSLAAGDVVLICNTGATMAMAEQRDNNRGASAVTSYTEGGKDYVYFTGTDVHELTIGKDGDNFTFYDAAATAGYLYAASSSSNHMKTQTTNDNNGKWALVIASGGDATVTAQGSNTRKIMRYNSSSKIFSCYASGQQAVVFYKKTTKTKSVSSGSGSITTDVDGCSSGPTIRANTNQWITAAAGQKVKTVIDVTAKNFEEAATLSATSSNAKFAISLAATAVPAGNTGLTTTLTVEYTPTESDVTESTTITFTAGAITKTITINGRSVPEEFLLITKKTLWYALPGNMNDGPHEYAGVVVTPDDGTSPTMVGVAPSTVLYSLSAVTSDRYAAHGNCVRLAGYNNLCLWSNKATGVDKVNIQNKVNVATASGDNYEWLLTTTDGIRYTIANPNHPQYEEGRRLAYGERFGLYNESTIFYIVTAGCTSLPEEVRVSARRVDVTFTWVSNAPEMTIDLYSDEGMTSLVKSETATGIPHTIFGLNEQTTYWYRLTPGADVACAATGSFTTTGPVIDVVEWEVDNAVVFVDKDESLTPKVIIDGEVEHGVGTGASATELFFSKYFEGSGNMKLLAFFNGTANDISLADYKISILTCGSPANEAAIASSEFTSTVNYDISALGSIKAGQEIIMYRWPDYKADTSDPLGALYDCSEDFLNGQEGKGDAEEKVRWIQCDGSTVYGGKTFPSFTFNGNDAICLLKNDVPIDIIGTTGAPGKVKNCANRLNDLGWTINVKNIDYGKESDDPSYDALYEASSKSPSDDTERRAVLAGFKVDLDNEYIDLTTARCILFRDKSVTSGEKAVALNTGNAFMTCNDFTYMGESYKSEWNGRQVCMSSSDQAAAGVSNDAKATCNSYQDLGAFDYSSYYKDWSNINPGLELDEHVRNADEKTYNIPIPNLAKYSCLNIRFQLKDGDEVLTETPVQVPILVTGEKSTNNAIFNEIVKTDLGVPVYDQSIIRCQTCDVVILGDGTLTKATDGATNDAQQVGNLKIYPGGKLVVPTSTHYTVNTLSFRRQEDEIASANIQGTLNVGTTNGTYLDLRIDPTNWHFISLPYDCKVSDIIFADGITPAKLGSDYLLQWYNGERRAATKNDDAWEPVAADATLKKGLGYIFALPGDGKVKREFRFPMSNDVITEDDDDKIAAPVYGYGCDQPTLGSNHKGWNLVGAPYLMPYTSDITSPLRTGKIVEDYSPEHMNPTWDGSWTDNGDGIYYIAVPINNGWDYYYQTTMAAYPLQPFTSYFVQVGGSDPTAPQGIGFNATSVPRSIVRRAPKEYEEVEDTHPVWCQIELTNPLGETDQTTILVSNDFTDKYDMQRDFVKMRGAYYNYYTRPVLASRNDEGEMAFNALPDASAETGIPLHYFAASSGSYTFTYNNRYDKDQEVKAVMLLDKQKNEWYDLMNEEYTFTSNRTENKDRFVLVVRVERKKTPQIATDIENIGSSDGPRKLLINGHVYIQRGNRIYDITGKQAVLQ